MLKFKIGKAAFDALTDEQKALYKASADGNSYTLNNVEGAVSKEDLDEFRNNNIELKRQVEELTKKFGAVNLDEYNEVMATRQKEKEKKLIDAGKVEELIVERLTPLEAKFKKDLAEREEKNSALTKQLEVLLIDQGVTTAAAAAGVKAAAIPDVINRARGISKVVDGKVVLMEGDKVLYGEDARTPLDYNSWLKGMAPKPEYQHLFEPSKGSDAKNSNKDLPAGTKTMARADFEKLDPVARSKAMTVDKIVLVD